MIRRAKADRKPTWTSLVFEEMVKADDFLSLPEIISRTGAAHNQATAALSHLSRHRAVESVAGGDGRLWWFAAPDTDTRMRHVDERCPEAPGTRRRKKSQTKGLHLPPTCSG